MAKTVIGLMDNRQDAQRVIEELVSGCGCERSGIALSERPAAGSAEHEGFFERLASSIRHLMGAGVPEDEAHTYGEGVRRGGVLVTVSAPTEAAADCATQLLQSHGALDVKQRAQEWRQQGWGGRVGAAGEDVLPLAEEELVVGKRRVGEGAVRVSTRVKEVPVEETVRLESEHAEIERRPVDRPLQAGDDAFAEKSIEVSETAEEPVVSKRSRVTEEVRVGKTASAREKTVQDTVRKTEVQVDKRTERRKSNTAYVGAERRVAGR